MSDRIATIHGVALSPGMSKNGRRYTPAAIQRAHDRLKERLADPNGRPVVMRAFHPASMSDLSVTNVAGRLTGVSLAENGDLRFDGDIANTSAGRDVAALVTPQKPYLANVSIHGLLVGEAAVDKDGVEIIDDVEIEALDFVTSPGIERARILSAVLAENDGRTLITETAEGTTVTVESKGDLTPDGSDYADPGYQKDGKKRYPLNSVKRIRAAWAYINVAANAKPYTPAQLKRIKGKIKSAAKKAGVDIAAETAALGADLAEILEAYASSCLDNGQGTVNVSGYTNEPADLSALGQRVALAALAGLAALDPDNDGDIDLAPGDAAPGGDDDQTCPNCGLICDPSDNFCPACGAQLPATESDDNALEGAASLTPGSSLGESSKGMEMPEDPNKPEGFAGVTVGVASPHGGTPPMTPAPAPAVVAEAAPAAPAAPAEPAPAAPAAGATAEVSEADLETFKRVATSLGLPIPAPESPTTAAPVVEAAPETAPSVTEGLAALEARLHRLEGEIAAADEKAAKANADLVQEAIALIRSGGRKGLVPTPVGENGSPKPMHEMTDAERTAHANETWAAFLGRTSY